VSEVKKTTERNVPGKKLSNAIEALSPPKVLAQTFVFVYKGQNPNVAIFVRQGGVVSGDQTFFVGSGDMGVLCAFSEILENRPLFTELRVLKDSKVSIIDRQMAKLLINFTCLESEKT